MHTEVELNDLETVVSMPLVVLRREVTILNPFMTEAVII